MLLGLQYFILLLLLLFFLLFIPSTAVNMTSGPPPPLASYTCTVCLDTATQPVVTKCGHLFCWPCLHQWASSQERETGGRLIPCPVCKGGLDVHRSGDVIPICGVTSSSTSATAAPATTGERRRAPAATTDAEPSPAASTGSSSSARRPAMGDTAPPPQPIRAAAPAPPPPRPERAHEPHPPPPQGGGWYGGGGGFFMMGGFGGLPLFFNIPIGQGAAAGARPWTAILPLLAVLFILNGASNMDWWLSALWSSSGDPFPSGSRGGGAGATGSWWYAFVSIIPQLCMVLAGALFILHVTGTPLEPMSWGRRLYFRLREYWNHYGMGSATNIALTAATVAAFVGGLAFAFTSLGSRRAAATSVKASSSSSSSISAAAATGEGWLSSLGLWRPDILVLIGAAVVVVAAVVLGAFLARRADVQHIGRSLWQRVMRGAQNIFFRRGGATMRANEAGAAEPPQPLSLWQQIQQAVFAWPPSPLVLLIGTLYFALMIAFFVLVQDVLWVGDAAPPRLSSHHRTAATRRTDGHDDAADDGVHRARQRASGRRLR